MEPFDKLENNSLEEIIDEVDYLFDWINNDSNESIEEQLIENVSSDINTDNNKISIVNPHNSLKEIKEFKQFPKLFENVINSADVTQVNSFVESTFSKACLISVNFPLKKVNGSGMAQLLKSFYSLFSFPDFICQLNSYKTEIIENGYKMIECKFRISATIMNQSTESYDRIRNLNSFDDVMKTYEPEKDKINRRAKTLKAIEEYKNNNKILRVYIKTKLRFLIDEKIGLILKYDSMPRLSSCEVLKDDYLD